MTIRLDSRLHFLVLYFFCLSLFLTVTNLIPLSISFVCLAPLIPLVIWSQRSASIYVLSVGALYLFFILNTMLYCPTSFLEFGFYRRDGNFFTTFLPVLLFSPLTLEVDLDNIIDRFIYFASAVNAVVLFTLYLPFMTSSSANVYSFLFQGHNPAGGFLAMLSCVTLGRWLVSKRPLLIFCLALNFFGLCWTYSRGSILGFVFSVTLVVLLKERFYKFFLSACVALNILLLTYTYPIWVESGKPSKINHLNVRHEVQNSREANIFDRAFLLWPRAVDLWLMSPFLGTGFGSYNDAPYKMYGIPYVFMMNHTNNPRFSSGHAHHSFLHILAETGLIGLGLTSLMLIYMRQEIYMLPNPSLRKGLLLAFWYAIWSSFTEHRLFTPSQMLPFILLLSLGISVRQSSQKPFCELNTHDL